MAKKHTPAQPPAPTVNEQQLLAFLVSDTRFPAEGYRSGMFALALSLGYANTLLSSVRLRGYLDALVADAHAGGLHMTLVGYARQHGYLSEVFASGSTQALLPAFFAAARGEGSLDVIVADAEKHGYMGDMLADARRLGYIADMFSAARTMPDHNFATLISASDPPEALLKDVVSLDRLPVLFDAAYTSGLLANMLTASYVTGLTGELLGWAKGRDLLGEVVHAARAATVDTADSNVNALLPGPHNRIAELLKHAAPLGYLGDLFTASFIAVAVAGKHGHEEAVADFERDFDSIPVLDRPYATILADVEMDLEARRIPFATQSIADRLVALAGDVGEALSAKYGVTGAARLIHRKARPDAPALRCDDYTQQGWMLAYLRERAAEEPPVSEEMPSAAVA